MVVADEERIEAGLPGGRGPFDHPASAFAVVRGAAGAGEGDANAHGMPPSVAAWGRPEGHFSAVLEGRGGAPPRFGVG